MARILLIEDEFWLRENISDLLELFNHQVTSAENGIEGLELLNIFRPDLILCDIMMPGLDGIGFLSKLSSDLVNKSIPLIFMSAKIDIETIKRGLILGAVDYIEKPFLINDLIAKINLTFRAIF